MVNPSSAVGINDAVPFKLRIRGAGACDPCVGSANRAGYAMSVYPTLSPPIVSQRDMAHIRAEPWLSCVAVCRSVS